MTGRYVALSRSLILSARRSFVVAAAVVVAVIVLGKTLPQSFMPEEDQGFILASITLPDASSLRLTDRAARQVERALAEAAGIETYTTITGFSLLSQAFTSNTGFFFIALKHWQERGSEEHSKAIVQQLNERFAAEIPSGMVVAFNPPAIPGLGTGSGFSMMLQDRGGNSPEYLAAAARDFLAAANARPEIAQAYTNFRAAVPQRAIDIDRSRVMSKGVTMADVNLALSALLGGAYVNDFNRFGRTYRVYVQAEPELRREDRALELFSVRGSEGNIVPLSSLIALPQRGSASNVGGVPDAAPGGGVFTTPIFGPDVTNRFNLFRSAGVQGAPAPGYSSRDAMSALEEVAAETLPPDMSYSWNGISYQESTSAGSVLPTFILAMVFVFLILAAQYESWTLPLSVLLGTPFAVLGAFGGLWLSRFVSPGYELNVFAQIGLVLLIGLAAKNAILIVEVARQRTLEGSNPMDAALAAARLRFRPILMTAFSFILGVLPLLVASGAGAEARKVMGMTVFCGMLSATVLGICFVPVLFVLVERVFRKTSRSA